MMHEAKCLLSNVQLLIINTAFTSLLRISLAFIFIINEQMLTSDRSECGLVAD